MNASAPTIPSEDTRSETSHSPDPSRRRRYFSLRSASVADFVNKGVKAGERLIHRQVSVQTNGTVSQVDLTVEPIAENTHDLEEIPVSARRSA